MIIKLFFVVLLFANFFSDVYGLDNAPNSSPNFDQQNEYVLQEKFPFQPYYNEGRRTMKSCNHKPGYHDNEWVNTYKRRLILQSPNSNASPINTELVSQSLKEENYQDPLNNKLGKSGDDAVSKYATNLFLNVLVDKNDDSVDEDHDSELRTPNNEVSDQCKNCINKLTSAESALNIDQKTSNKRILFEANKNDSIETRRSKSSKIGDLALSSEEIQKLKNCVTVKPKSNKDNNLLEQSNLLYNYDDDQDSLQNENLGDTRRMNNEPLTSLNSHDSLEKPHDLNNEINELPDPTKGVGITRLSGSKMLLSGSSRVCYACTSANNPNCLLPDRQTTVKYCRKDHNACVTRTFNAQNTQMIIRDCASSCDDESPGITLKYKSCSICHSDLCNDTNGAYSINSHYLIVGLIVMSFIRRTL